MALSEARNKQAEYDWDQSTIREFNKVKERTVQIFLSLKEVIELGIADADIVGLTMDILALNDPEDTEAVSKILVTKIGQADDSMKVEALAKLANKLSPSATERELRKLYADAIEPQTKDNAKRVLLLLGENPVTIVEGA